MCNASLLCKLTCPGSRKWPDYVQDCLHEHRGFNGDDPRHELGDGARRARVALLARGHDDMRAGEAVTLVARTRREPGLPTLPGQAREMSVKRRLTKTWPNWSRCAPSSTRRSPTPSRGCGPSTAAPGPTSAGASARRGRPHRCATALRGTMTRMIDPRSKPVATTQRYVATGRARLREVAGAAA